MTNLGARSPKSHRRIHSVVGWTMVGMWATLGLLIGVAYNQSWINGHRQSSVAVSPGVEIGITNPRVDSVGEEPYKAPPGFKFAIVTISVTNSSNVVFNFAPVVQTSVSDSSGQKFAMSPALLKSPVEAGPLEPGQSRSGEVSYLVPSGATSLTYIFDDPQTHTHQQNTVTLGN